MKKYVFEVIVELINHEVYRYLFRAVNYKTIIKRVTAEFCDECILSMEINRFRDGYNENK